MNDDDDCPPLPSSVKLAAQTSAERRRREKEKMESNSKTMVLTSPIFSKKKEGESLFLLSLSEDGTKIADEMNPILGMYRMPTPAYYLRGCFPMGDLKCILKCNSKNVPVTIPTHMDKVVREWIRDGFKEILYGPPPEEKKKDSERSIDEMGIPKDFEEVPVWQFKDEFKEWKDYLKNDQRALENAFQDPSVSKVTIDNRFGTFEIDMSDESQMSQLNSDTKTKRIVRRLPGSPVYPNMPEGARVEVEYRGKWYPGHYVRYDDFRRKYKVQCDEDRAGNYTSAKRECVRRMLREGLPDKNETDETTKDDDEDEEKTTDDKDEVQEDRIKDEDIDTDYEFDFFWVVSDVSTIVKKHHASIWNLVVHPWCFPKVTLGSPDALNIIPIGLFTTMHPDRCHLEEAKQSNGLTVNDLCFMKVHVHKHARDEWAMCCSPDNAAFRMSRRADLSFFWSATIMGLPDAPDRGRSHARDEETKPTFPEESKLKKFDNACFHGAEQITSTNAKMWRKDESLRLIRGKPTTGVDGKTTYKDPNWMGCYFDRMGTDCQITFDCLEKQAFRATMLKGGHKTRWEVQHSDDKKEWTTAKAFPKTLTKGWDTLEWGDVGAHRYWRFNCLENPKDAIDYYRGVEWYVGDDGGDSDEDDRNGTKPNKPKVRVCMSLQWIMHRPNAKLSRIFDEAMNLGELLTKLNAYFAGTDDEKILYDLNLMLSQVTKWKASEAVQAKREKFMNNVKASRGFQKAKKGREFSRSWGGRGGGTSWNSGGSSWNSSWMI